ncbi:hypothetical protein OCS_02843 [Ophiocordyceps sinensis CO18]|uniref:NAD dependent epimerase/dehydratase n=1 Tax=Ophiocordyceps sinensis (strain Co18 / CGMCC 3.14243) TaxID=911162 RepID=T5AG92_OPHSC|nr:hypothetical protein OCS_02843 [Ophiocordyceps sinensis CO18]
MASIKQRAIDTLPDVKDAMGMEILVLGMPRTGSISIRHALRELGYTCFHGAILEESPEKFAFWEEAIRAKYYGEGQPFGRRELDKLLGGFNVAINYPGTMFAEEMIRAYPNAKVILTTRDVDKWQESLKRSVDASITWRSFDWIAPFDPIWGPWWRFHKLEHRIRPLIAPRGERRAFLDHYETMKKLVPKERLLEYRVGEGWERLCEFLGKDVPVGPFPHVNKTGQFLDGRRMRWWHAFWCMIARLSPAVGMALAGMATAWWYRHGLS